MLSISTEKQRKRPFFSNFVWHTDGRGAGGRKGQDLANGNILYNCLFLLFQMLSISIEKQRTRPPFFKFCLADGWAGSRRAEGPDLSNGNIFYDLSFVPFEKL